MTKVDSASTTDGWRFRLRITCLSLHSEFI